MRRRKTKKTKNPPPPRLLLLRVFLCGAEAFLGAAASRCQCCCCVSEVKIDRRHSLADALFFPALMVRPRRHSNHQNRRFPIGCLPPCAANGAGGAEVPPLLSTLFVVALSRSRPPTSVHLGGAVIFVSVVSTSIQSLYVLPITLHSPHSSSPPQISLSVSLSHHLPCRFLLPHSFLLVCISAFLNSGPNLICTKH